MYLPYIIIPLITILTATIGSSATMGALNTWYKTLLLPPYTPPGSFIGIVWSVLYILVTASALLVWQKKLTKGKKVDKKFLQWRRDVSTVFVVNAALNALWSILFFGLHMLLLAVFDALFMGVSIAILIQLIWPRKKLAALLLVPYLLWVAFATHLTYTVWIMNK